MATKKPRKNNSDYDYRSTATLIEGVQRDLDTFLDEDSYSKASKELAAKIFLEWSRALKQKVKKLKKPNKNDIKTIAFLEGYAKFLS